MKFIIIIILSVGLISHLQSQDKILKISGEEIPCKITVSGKKSLAYIRNGNNHVETISFSQITCYIKDVDGNLQYYYPHNISYNTIEENCTDTFLLNLSLGAGMAHAGFGLKLLIFPENIIQFHISLGYSYFADTDMSTIAYSVGLQAFVKGAYLRLGYGLNGYYTENLSSQYREGYFHGFQIELGYQYRFKKFSINAGIGFHSSKYTNSENNQVTYDGLGIDFGIGYYLQKKQTLKD